MVYLKQEYIKLLRQLEVDGTKITRGLVQKTLNIRESEAKIYVDLLKNYDVLSTVFLDSEIVAENQRLSASKQKYADKNRIERKSYRDEVRQTNALIELNKAALSALEKVDFNIDTIESPSAYLLGNTAIIQVSDTHFNELINLPSNKYDFMIASRRMQKYASEAKLVLNAHGVESVVVMMTGDLINSDRRLDEKMAMAANRTMASMVATSLMQYFINDLASNFSEIKVAYVSGNESRVGQEFGFVNQVVTDNYDTLIYNVLKKLYAKDKLSSVTFLDSNPTEAILSINGRRILCLHGTTLGSVTQKSIQSLIGKYAATGVVVDYVIFGHIHFAEITDLYARSGSLVGGNSYSDSALGLSTKPSQNIHLITSKGQINNFRIELEDIQDFSGYPIQAELLACNAKSVSETIPAPQVVQVL